MWGHERGQMSSGNPSRGNLVAGVLTLACIAGILALIATATGRPAIAAVPPISAGAMASGEGRALAPARVSYDAHTAVPFPHPTATFTFTPTPTPSGCGL